MRDVVAARRVAMWFAFVGGTFCLAEMLLVPASAGSSTGRLVVGALSCASIAFAGWARFWPERVPAAALAFWANLSVVAVVMADVFSGDHSAGAQMFFLWPVLMAAYLLLRPAAVVVLLGAATGDVIVVGVGSPNPYAVTDAASTIVTLVVLTIAVVTLRQRLDRVHTELADRATHDPLTGLLNRRAFDETLEQAVASSLRNDESLALLVVDLDNLKRINDSGGHAAGDLALEHTAAALTAAAGDGSAFRLGGDEFALLLPGRDPAAASAHAETVQSLLTPWGLSVSVGIAGLPGATCPRALLAEADAALYSAKRASRSAENSLV